MGEKWVLNLEKVDSDGILESVGTLVIDDENVMRVNDMRISQVIELLTKGTKKLK